MLFRSRRGEKKAFGSGVETSPGGRIETGGTNQASGDGDPRPDEGKRRSHGGPKSGAMQIGIARIEAERTGDPPKDDGRGTSEVTDLNGDSDEHAHVQNTNK